jgi:hypothetical protein
MTNRIWILIGTNGFQDLLVAACAFEKSVYRRILDHVYEMENSSGIIQELTWRKETDTLIVARHGMVLYSANLMEIYTKTETER